MMTETTATTTGQTAATDHAEPTDPLARASLEALAAYREAQAASNRADEAFRASVAPKIWELHKEFDELDQLVRDASMDMHVAELCRHAPGLAPAIRLLWAHVIDIRLDRVGRCCTDGGPIDP